MIRILLPLAFSMGVALLLIPASAQETPPPPSPVGPPEQNAPIIATFTQLQLEDCSSLLCVVMTASDGKTLHLVLDLGERNAYLSLRAAKSLGLDLHPFMSKDGNAIPDVQQTIVPGAKLGDLPMGDFPFVVIDVEPERNLQEPRKETLAKPLPGDGALTYGAFQNRVVQLDIPNHILRISKPQINAQPCPRECSDLITKHVGQFGPVTITADGFAVNGQPVDAQIDTLFTGTMLIYPAGIERLDLKKQAKSKDKQTFPYIHDGIELAQWNGASESYRNISLAQNAPLYFPLKHEAFANVQFDATVGDGLLSRGVVTFDFKGNHFWIDPPNPSSPVPVNQP
jgi:hypothetical protein